MGSVKKLQQLYFKIWRHGLLAASLGLIAYLLYFNNVLHLLPGYDAGELRTYAGAADWHHIVSNPVNAPYKAVLWLTIALGHHSIAQARVVAAAFGIIAAILFYMIVKHWHGFRTAFLSTILFATSAGFLHVARLGSAQVMQMGILLFMGAVLSYGPLAKRHKIASFVFVGLLAILVYLPGLIWIELVGLFLIRRGLLARLRRATSLSLAIGSGIALVLLLPLIMAAIRQPSVLQGVAGLPAHFSDLKHMPAQIGDALLAVGIRSSGNPELFVGHAPLLNTIELALGIMGIYYYWRHDRSARTMFLTSLTVASFIIIGLGGAAGLALVLPLLYLFVACGLSNLFSQWLTVFPRNPIAKYGGLGLVCVMLVFSVLYQVRSYYVAWPHNARTKQEFDLRQP